MTKRWMACLALAALVAGCVAHEKSGDQAAAVGDWKSAYLAYRHAMAEKPETPGLQAKFEQAREEAVVQARQRADACAPVEDWTCVQSEAEFLLTVDPSDARAAQLRSDAANHRARAYLQDAVAHARGGQLEEGIGNYDRALEVAQGQTLAGELGAVRDELVMLGQAEVERRARANAFDEALSLARRVAALDPGRRQLVAWVEAEREAELLRQYEQRAREGDRALAQQDWATAQRHYQAALGLKAGGRAEPLAAYASALVNAEAAVAARDYVAASAAADAAVRTGQDRSGHAAGLLERVRVRPYRIALRSVTVDPIRPDGSPWAGSLSPLLGRLTRAVLAAAENPRMQVRLVEAAMSLPAENRPDLRVEITLPSGERLVTPSKNGIYAGFDSELVVMTNQIDDRVLTFQVLAGAEEIGRIEVPIREVTERRDLVTRGGGVLQLVLAAGPADGRREGSHLALTPVVEAPAAAATPDAAPVPAGTPPPGRSGGTTVPASGTSAPPEAPPPAPRRTR